MKEENSKKVVRAKSYREIMSGIKLGRELYDESLISNTEFRFILGSLKKDLDYIERLKHR
jgi:hypothetical protein